MLGLLVCLALLCALADNGEMIQVSVETITIVSGFIATIVTVVGFSWGMTRSLRTEMKSEISGLRGEMKSGFQAVNQRIDTTNTRIDSMSVSLNDRLDKTNARIDAMNVSLNDRLETTNARIDSTNARIDRLSEVLMVPASRAG